MGMKLDEAIKRYKNNAEFERTHGNLQGGLEFRQLAKWLEELRAYRKMHRAKNVDNCLRAEVEDEKTNKEESLDWLYRLRSEIYVYMPKKWLIPMNNALDVAIDTVKREKWLEDWTKKCRKFEADYENRLKSDLVAMLDKIRTEIIQVVAEETKEDPKWASGLKYSIKIIDKHTAGSEPQESEDK